MALPHTATMERLPRAVDDDSHPLSRLDAPGMQISPPCFVRGPRESCLAARLTGLRRRLTLRSLARLGGQQIMFKAGAAHLRSSHQKPAGHVIPSQANLLRGRQFSFRRGMISRPAPSPLQPTPRCMIAMSGYEVRTHGVPRERAGIDRETTNVVGSKAICDAIRAITPAPDGTGMRDAVDAC
jgi:hypothetical protein